MNLQRDTGPILRPNTSEVLLQSLSPSSLKEVQRIAKQVMDANIMQVQHQVKRLRELWAHRVSENLDSVLRRQALLAAAMIQVDPDFGQPRSDGEVNWKQLLFGSYFLQERSVQSAALFNPSIVAASTSVCASPATDCKFCNKTLGCCPQPVVLSLRACGENHTSSVMFRSGWVSCDGIVSLNPVDLTKPLSPATIIEDKGTSFAFQFSKSTPLDRRVVLLESVTHHNSIEDLRLVRFRSTNEEGEAADDTFTAFNGHEIRAQMLCTKDWNTFDVRDLLGTSICNKGFALFPRQIQGRYWMLGRQDDRSITIMSNTVSTFGPWNNYQVLLSPAELWEVFKMGNCGSPIETKYGWLVLTHGVGPMRRYCVGAAILALEDPTKVLGRLGQPLLEPIEDEREGYVPNVVYSCGGMLSRDTERVVIPYAASDTTTRFATVSLPGLLMKMGVARSSL